MDMNRFTLTAASKDEFAAWALMIRAIGGSIEEGSHTVEHGAFSFKVLMNDGQYATFQLIRQIPNCERNFVATHNLVAALGGSIKDGSLTYDNNKMNPTIQLDKAGQEIYRMMHAL